MIRPMRVFEDSDVRAIYRACHPTWPAQRSRWYEAHPTLVLEVDTAIVGFTSYSVGPPTDPALHGEMMVGYGIDIAPGHQGQGYGRLLCDERLAIARAVGAATFVGHAAPDNHAMIRLFERDGFKPFGEAKDPDGGLILLYVGPIR
jgi:RimJ/RimL family protein N-acetyltransferase